MFVCVLDHNHLSSRIAHTEQQIGLYNLQMPAAERREEEKRELRGRKICEERGRREEEEGGSVRSDSGLIQVCFLQHN